MHFVIVVFPYYTHFFFFENRTFVRSFEEHSFQCELICAGLFVDKILTTWPRK